MPVRRISITRKRKLKQSGGSSQPGDIYVFYHVYCNKNTETVVKDQVFRIIFSGLYAKVNRIYKKYILMLFLKYVINQTMQQVHSII